jgi:phenylacetate-CoA ligase
MPRRTPVAGDLDPIERASRDQLESLQLERLEWSSTSSPT